MMKNKLINLILISVIFWPLALSASDNAGAFIEKGLSPRAAAMGMSQVCLAENSDTVYWNSASLAKSNVTEIKVMGSNAYETNYNSLQGIGSFWGMNWGLAYIGASVEGISETAENQTTKRYEKTGNTLAYNASAYYLSTAKEITQELSVGISAKLIQEKAAQYEAKGAGLDLGVLYEPLEWLNFGLNCQNLISPSMEWNTPSKNVDTIPLNIKAGISTNLFDDSLFVGVDLNFRKNRSTKVNFGMEYWLNDFFAIRGGLDQGELSLGTGLVLDRFILDFSWSNPSLNEIDDVFRVAVGYRISN